MTERATRLRQDDRLLPLGGHQYLVLAACSYLLSDATAPAVHNRLIAAGLPGTTLGQIYITLQRLAARGLLDTKREPTATDPTRKVKIHTLTAHGRSVLEQANRNYRLVVDVASWLAH